VDSGWISQAGAEAVDLGIVADLAQGIEATILEALSRVDVLVTSGGVSMGTLDLVKPLLSKIGKVHFGRHVMKFYHDVSHCGFF
jgi:molybdopterin biosynthesis enzyme